MKSFYLTDVGRIRTHNEDSVTIIKNNSNEYLMIVADGMGGHKAGEVASSIAVTHMGKEFRSLNSMGSEIDAAKWLVKIVNEINQEILDYAKVHVESTGLGTTLVTALLTKDYLIVGNIGDSSGFVMKKHKLQKVTKDHTYLNFLVEKGNLTVQEAENCPGKNILMRALGASEDADFDLVEVDMGAEEILLCSDGLTNMLTREQIEKVLNDDTLDMEEKVSKLIRKSNARGGTDNISIAYLVREEGIDY